MKRMTSGKRMLLYESGLKCRNNTDSKQITTREQTRLLFKANEQVNYDKSCWKAFNTSDVVKKLYEIQKVQRRSSDRLIMALR